MLEIPRNARTQLDLLTPYGDYPLTHQELHVPLVKLMAEEGIRIHASDCTTKPPERITEELNRRGWDHPLSDIHTALLILRKPDFPAATEAIFSKWPTPELVYPGLESFRDYDNPETRAGSNRNSDRGYRATHLNIHVPFGARIAEVRLFTVEDYRFYLATGAADVARQRGLTH